jgi:hypothetical protein
MVRIKKIPLVARTARVMLALCVALALVCTPGATVFAAPDYTYDTIHTFSISDGPITITNGTTAETLGVWYGPAPQAFHDLILPDEIIDITGASTNNSITVNTTRLAHINLDNVSINRSLPRTDGTIDNACAFSLMPGANVVLSLSGENTLTSGSSYAGIRVPPTASLEILGDLNYMSSNDIVLVIDNSGSISSGTLNTVKQEAVRFCEKILNEIPNSRIAAVSFADTGIVVKGFNSYTDELTAAINGIKECGETNPYSGLHEANKLLQSSDSGSVILLSDGKPNLPHGKALSPEALAVDEAKDIMTRRDIYSIGVYPPYEEAKQFLRDCQNKGYYDIDIDTSLDLSLDLQDAFGDIRKIISKATAPPGKLTALSAAPTGLIPNDPSTYRGGAGIGGNDGEGAGGITIRDARVIAYSGGYGAGLGGGRNGNGGKFLLDGGAVEAYSAFHSDRNGYGAGVGGGINGSGGSIAISGGKLLACGASNAGDGYGAGLGSGAYGANGGDIAIVRADVEASGARGSGDGYGAGIGGGYRSPAGTVVITDHHRVIAQSVSGGAGTGRGADIGAGHENNNHGNQLILTNSPGGDYLIGNVVLPSAIDRYVISFLDRLIIPRGASLRIPSNVTLVNDGIIENYGSLINDFRLVNNGRLDNFADLRNIGQFIQNPGSFFNGSFPIAPPDTSSYLERDPYWYTPGGSGRSLRAANDKVWVDYGLSGTVATLYLTPGKAEDIVRNSEDGTADFDLSGIGGLTEWSFPKASLAYFSEKGLNIEFQTPLGVVRLSRAAAADIAEQGGGEQLHLRFRRVEIYTLNLAQRSALRADDAVYELSASVDGQRLRDAGGPVTAVVPYTGELPAGAWLLSENGRRTAAAFSYENNALRFTSDVFSLFAVGRGGAPATDTNVPWYYVR